MNTWRVNPPTDTKETLGYPDIDNSSHSISILTTKSLSIMPLEITRQTRLEKDLCNLAIFRANMAVKQLEEKR